MHNLEKKANELFEHYVHLYYDNAVSSVFFIDTASAGFTAYFCVKKEVKNIRDIKNGVWDASHEVICSLKAATKTEPTMGNYKVNSTIHMVIESESRGLGLMAISGTWKHSSPETLQIPVFADSDLADSFHLKTIGRMIEYNEAFLSNEALEHYISKMRQVTNKGRKMDADTLENELKTELLQATSKIKGGLKAGDSVIFDANSKG